MKNPAVRCFVAVLLATASFAAFAQSSAVVVRVTGVSSAEAPAVSKVLQARFDELRTSWFGSTSSKVEGNLVTLSFSGWAPKTREAEVLAVAKRSFRVVVEPAQSDVLITEADIADARSGNRTTPELYVRLNDAGVLKLKARGTSFIGKVVSTYWNGRLVCRSRISAELVQDIAITVPSIEDASIIAIVLRSGALPSGTALQLAR
jgi:hypothetical protein